MLQIRLEPLALHNGGSFPRLIMTWMTDNLQQRFDIFYVSYLFFATRNWGFQEGVAALCLNLDKKQTGWNECTHLSVFGPQLSRSGVGDFLVQADI